MDEPEIKKIASRIGCTTAQVCIGYALAKGLVVVTKTEKESRMKENLASIEVAGKLSKDDIQLIDTLNRNLRKFWDVYQILWNESISFVKEMKNVQCKFPSFDICINNFILTGY